MITKNTSDAYFNLFYKANARLIEAGIQVEDENGDLVPLDIVESTDENGNIVYTGNDAIRTLEQYFEHLNHLVYGGDQQFEEEALLFLKLPLDEPYFTIDANTRTINVPSHFQTHGLSVQGDEVAEIVFFEVDRYYDATDLYNMNIAIEWEMPVPGQPPHKGHTAAFIKATHDLVDPDNKDRVIFGWPITSAITKYWGKLKFSVRFYDGDDGNQDYTFSLRTTPAIININQSLEIDPLHSTADDASKLILNRVVNSLKDGSYGDPSFPLIIWNDQTIDPIDGVYEAIKEDTYLVVLANGGPRSGSLSYAWYRNDNGIDTIKEENRISDWNTLSEASMYVPVDHFITYSETLTNGEVKTYSISRYYDSNNEPVELIYDEDGFNAALLKYEELRVLAAYYKLPKDETYAGTYTVDVTNKFYGKTKLASKNPHNKAPSWVVKGPDVLSIKTDLPLYYHIENLTGLKVELENASDETSYQWYFSKIKDNGFTGKIGATEATYIPVINDPDDEGYYYLHAINTRNMGTSSIESAKCLAVNPINDKFVNSIKLTVQNNQVIASSTDGRVLDAPYDYEDYSCTWFIFNALQDKIDTIENKSITLNIDEIKALYPDATNVSFMYEVTKEGIDKPVTSVLQNYPI